jgi:hypothetical protein
MTNEFIIVGEHRTDHQQFLVRGADGRFYDYQPARDNLEPVDLDTDTWEITAPEVLAMADGDPGASIDLDVF